MAWRTLGEAGRQYKEGIRTGAFHCINNKRYVPYLYIFTSMLTQVGMFRVICMGQINNR